MKLTKPQNKAVEMVLTDCYDAGRNAVLKAFCDWKDQKSSIDFLPWYQQNKNKYKMEFKVKED